MRRIASFITLSLTVLLTTSCQIERLFADQVGGGVARLTVLTGGALITVAEADETCGFASGNVKVTTEGSPGQLGTATFSITDCEVVFPKRTAISTDCNGDRTVVKGRVLFKEVRRTVAGTLTGDPTNPVIPASADAVTITMQTELEDFYAEGSNPAVATMKKANLNFEARPRLAVGTQAPGVCSVATPNVLFSSVVLSNALVWLYDGESRTVEVDVDSSDFFAQNGRGPNGRENHISGGITIWGGTVDLGKTSDLDDTYIAGEFIDSYAGAECLEQKDGDRILLPLSFACEGVDSVVADGAARLLVQDLGIIATLAEADQSCGFSTVEPAVSGTPGAPGSATWIISECAITFPEDTVLSTDCQGNETLVGGTVVVSGTKRIDGWLSGNADNPAVPLDDRPASINITAARMTNFKVGSAKGSLTLPSGVLSGEVAPRTALGRDTQACSVTTRHAQIDDLSFQGQTNARVASPQGVFEVVLEGATINATNGVVGDATNTIAGEIVVGGENYDLSELPSGNTLDTTFDLAQFEAGFSCDEALVQPISYTCDFESVLAGGFASLSVNTLAQVAQAAEADESCGFSSPSVIANATINGELGRRGGSATLTMTDCELNFATPVTSTDCTGVETTISGRVVVSGTKTLEGIVSGDPNEPIVPTSWDPATINITSAVMDSFSVTSSVSQGVRVIDGTLSGTLNPRTALDTATGACSIATPVAAIDLSWSTAANLELISGENTVFGRVDAATLGAVNGARDGAENQLQGSLNLAGNEFDVTGPLNPNYDAVTFADSYTCQPGFRAPATEEDCGFYKTLGDGAARLIIQAVGEVTTVANAEGGCAFSGFGTLTSPIEVIGDAGEQGSLRFEIEECELGPGDFIDGPETYGEPDCDGVQGFHQGFFTVDAQRLVRGTREDAAFGNDSIVPNARDSVTVTLQRVDFTDFRPFNLYADGTSADPGVLTLHSGSLSGIVNPVLGENAGTPGRFDVRTPVSALDDIVLTGAEVTLEAQGKTFKFTVSDTDITAFNGSYQGRTNEIGGHIVVDGTRVELGGELQPDYDQQAFDDAYSCNEDLVGIVIP